MIVTHHHPDHVGLAGWFQSRGAELADDPHRLASGADAGARRAAPAHGGAAGLLARGGDGADGTGPPRGTERPFNFADCVAPLPLGFTRIAEGDTLILGGRRWQVRIGHGHAPDHATLWSLDDDLVLGGDQLLPGISPNIGVYATEPEADPLAEWIAACRASSPCARDDHLVLPGHKLPFTGLPLRLTQMIDNHDSALDRLRALPDRTAPRHRLLFSAVQAPHRTGRGRPRSGRGGGPPQSPAATGRGGS